MKEQTHGRMLLLLFLVCGVCLTGCKSVKVEEEKEDILVEYAANALLKHDKRFNNKALLTETTTKKETTRYVVETAKQEETTTKANQSGQSSKTGKDAQTNQNVTFAQVMGLTNFNVAYNGYIVTDTYPKEKTADLSSGVTAAQNKKLVVLQFTVKNAGKKKKKLNMLEKRLNYQLEIGDNEVQYARIPALLLNALNTYNDTINAGKSKELVLIFEVSEKSAKDMKDISLTITGGDIEGTIALK